jgi:hypothetical protein
MKTTTTLFFGFIVMLSCNGQEKNIGNDKLLAKLQAELKDNWEMKISNDSLIIESRNYIWIDFYNSAGVPVDDPEYDKYTDDYLQKNGRKTKMIKILSMQPKWDSVQIKKVIAENKKIGEEMDSLIFKYDLSHVKRSFRYDEELIWNATDKEQERFEEYKKEKETLRKKIQGLPIYNSEKYSLFIVSKTWNFSEDGGYYMLPMIYPKSEEKKINILEKSLSDVLNSIP